MPEIKRCKLLKVHATIEGCLGRLCPTDGQCRDAGTIATSLKKTDGAQWPL